MSFSRRQFIQASGIALCAGAVPLKANAAGQQQPLPVPPAGVPSGTAAIYDAATCALVVYAGHARTRMGC